MATVTGLTAERMLEIEASSVVGARVEDGDLILITHGGTEINVGSVAGPTGPQGPAGPPGLSSIPGEVKMWIGTTLPDLATYGKWVWADGQDYAIADYPIAAAHLSDLWDTFDGASDPGDLRFRVPDMRGLVPAGMDAMPGGIRGSADRMIRVDADTIAKRTGKETHALDSSQMPSHTHTYSGGHLHAPYGTNNKFLVTLDVGEGLFGNVQQGSVPPYNLYKEGATSFADASPLNPTGGGGSHENVQPTVFVPYIVCLDS